MFKTFWENRFDSGSICETFNTFKRGKMSNGIVVAQWYDKRDVRFLTTKHDLRTVTKRNKRSQMVTKPEAIFDYNKAKQGVDVSDKLASYFSPLKKTIRWYHKVVFELLFNTTVLGHVTPGGHNAFSMAACGESFLRSMLALNVLKRKNLNLKTSKKQKMYEKVKNPAK